MYIGFRRNHTLQCHFNLPPETMLGVLPMIVQGVQCSMQYGTTNWGTNYGMWNINDGGYHKAIDGFVVESNLVIHAGLGLYWIVQGMVGVLRTASIFGLFINKASIA